MAGHFLSAAAALLLAGSVAGQPTPPRNVSAYPGDGQATIVWTPQDAGTATQYESEWPAKREIEVGRTFPMGGRDGRYTCPARGPGNVWPATHPRMLREILWS
jgi:hypothetical protein